MNRRIWASLDDYLPPSKVEKLVGKGVANYNFLEALLRYGHFDEYHFFLVNQAHKKAFEAAHADLFRQVKAGSCVKVFYRSQLPDAVRAYDYTVFHQTDHIVHFNSLCHFRNRAGSFPVTSFIHSISYPSMMLHLQEMSFGGVTSQDAVICSSDAGRRVLRDWFQQIEEMRHIPPPDVRMEVIPFGFDSTSFDRVGRKEARARMGLSENEVIALCFGRFSEYDKMDLFPLLQAFHKVHGKGRPWRLILAGAAHHPEYVSMVDLWIKALGLQGSTVLKTDISDSDKAVLFKAADFFVSPSDNLQETFGLTLVEALAAGLPLIVSDFSGYREIARPEVARLIPTRWSPLELFSTMEFGPLADEASLHRYMAQSVCVDIDRLAQAMAELFSYPGGCRQMGTLARKRFETCYDYRLIIERLEDLWLRMKRDFVRDARPACRQPLFPNYFRSFSHYFTGHVRSHDRVRKTDFAEALLTAGQDYPLLPGMDQAVNRERVRGIALFASEPRSVDEIIGRMGSRGGKIHYQIMWMLKHGLLETVEEQNHEHSFV
ncbi:MAG: glycosyltransferase family 4 protein [Deltaproteobacteria bacterium]|nr:glycosyltransferase family 4 protein [Deltaproteobacteria bacterium]